MPLTTKPPVLPAVTVPLELVPSPQVIVAEKSEAVPFGLASVNVATGPVNWVPATAVKLTGLAVSGASATLTSNGVCSLAPSLFFQLIARVVDAFLGVRVCAGHLAEGIDRAC